MSESKWKAKQQRAWGAIVKQVIAHHEAGHAVIARHLGLHVERVTIVSTVGKGGEALSECATYAARKEDMARQVKARQTDVKVR